jgi:hypothetical protein
MNWLSRILMLLSVMTIICHNSIAHHHHENMKPFVHHDHEHHHNNNSHDTDDASGDEQHHNIFSFAQLDDSYLPSQFGKLTIEVPILYLLTPTFVLQVDKLNATPTTHLFHREDVLVSLYFSSGLFSRPPPPAQLN